MIAPTFQSVIDWNNGCASVDYQEEWDGRRDRFDFALTDTNGEPLF
jgi:hypothetical protein